MPKPEVMDVYGDTFDRDRLPELTSPYRHGSDILVQPGGETSAEEEPSTAYAIRSATDT